jgi:hypothetical protein
VATAARTGTEELREPMRRVAAGVVSTATVVFAMVLAAPASACNEPRVTASAPKAGPDATVNGSAHAGDPVSVVLTDTSQGAPYTIYVEGEPVKEGVDTTRDPGIWDLSFEMPDLGDVSRSVEVTLTIGAHPDWSGGAPLVSNVYYLAPGAPVPGTRAAEPDSARPPAQSDSEPTSGATEQPALQTDQPASEQAPNTTSSTPQPGSGPAGPGDGGGDPGSPTGPVAPNGSETVAPAIERREVVTVASVRSHVRRARALVERAPATKRREGARTAPAPLIILRPAEPRPARPAREQVPVELVIAIFIAIGFGAAVGLVLRRRAAGQEPAPVPVPAAPGAPPTVVALDPNEVEAELQELIAEAKAKELAAADGGDHARDGPLVGASR